MQPITHVQAQPMVDSSSDSMLTDLSNTVSTFSILNSNPPWIILVPEEANGLTPISLANIKTYLLSGIININKRAKKSTEYKLFPHEITFPEETCKVNILCSTYLYYQRCMAAEQVPPKGGRLLCAFTDGSEHLQKALQTSHPDWSKVSLLYSKVNVFLLKYRDMQTPPAVQKVNIKVLTVGRDSSRHHDKVVLATIWSDLHAILSSSVEIIEEEVED
jgi:hypothetical protein